MVSSDIEGLFEDSDIDDGAQRRLILAPFGMNKWTLKNGRQDYVGRKRRETIVDLGRVH
jgi:hypothetical protein